MMCLDRFVLTVISYLGGVPRENTPAVQERGVLKTMARPA